MPYIYSNDSLLKTNTTTRTRSSSSPIPLSKVNFAKMLLSQSDDKQTIVDDTEIINPTTKLFVPLYDAKNCILSSADELRACRVSDDMDIECLEKSRHRASTVPLCGSKSPLLKELLQKSMKFKEEDVTVSSKRNMNELRMKFIEDESKRSEKIWS